MLLAHFGPAIFACPTVSYTFSLHVLPHTARPSQRPRPHQPRFRSHHKQKLDCRRSPRRESQRLPKAVRRSCGIPSRSSTRRAMYLSEQPGLSIFCSEIVPRRWLVLDRKPTMSRIQFIRVYNGRLYPGSPDARRVHRKSVHFRDAARCPHRFFRSSN